MVKSNAFSKISRFDQFNFGCINFNLDTYESNGHKLMSNPDKFFITPSNEAITPYFMMGISRDFDLNKYIPVTIIAPENFGAFIEGQTLTIPTQILISDNQDFNKLNATNEEKLQLLNLYKRILNEYQTNSKIEIFSDYENMLRENVSLSLGRKN